MTRNAGRKHAALNPGNTRHVAGRNQRQAHEYRPYLEVLEDRMLLTSGALLVTGATGRAR